MLHVLFHCLNWNLITLCLCVAKQTLVADNGLGSACDERHPTSVWFAATCFVLLLQVCALKKKSLYLRWCSLTSVKKIENCEFFEKENPILE